ncbi:hypothetical protein MLD38_026027 [Melastoma candidum]|uniref:Uncharacterized protein n=1 Tax=Melastoma candidum TaxID=119954 RepID=A0ACB9NY92_9MYRT|nr:hypothetical protein MLD38_026027 [Melastoma candidum]
MDPFDYIAVVGANSPSSTLSSSASSIAKPPPNDRLLADAGYKGPSSNLPHLAYRLELVDSYTSPVKSLSLSPSALIPPSLMIFRLYHSMHTRMPTTIPLTSPPGWTSFSPNSLDPDVAAQLGCWSSTGPPGAFAQQNPNGAAAAPQMASLTALEEDSGIGLVHMLMSCAERVHSGEFQVATTLLDEM